MAVNHGNLPGTRMLCGCIDIGTNTTRVLVADVEDGRLTEVLQRRAFTRLRRTGPGGEVPGETIDELARVVAAQRALAERIGARRLRVVGTAGVRGAPNRDALLAALRERAGVEVCVLDGREEAELAFLGATRTLGAPLPGEIGVVDVGGGSTELAVGTLAAGVHWSVSFQIGSGYLTEHYRRVDPPSAGELAAIRAHAHGALEGLDVPVPDRAVAVGGSAASLRRLVGAVLEPETLQRALRVLSSAPAHEVASRFAIAPERVRLLPAGILVLEACSHALGRPLQIGKGGLREGVVLTLGAGNTL